MATIRGHLSALDSELNKAVALVDSVRELRFPQSSSRRFPALPNFQVALIAELAFLRCFLSWEVFLEECFLSYAEGALSPSGNTFPCFLSAPSRNHIQAIIKGERRSYAAWVNHQQVIERAKLYFEGGEPFDAALSTVSSALSDMIVVRNRIAHRSGSSSEKFLALVRRLNGAVAPGMTPGRFLLAEGLTVGVRRLDEYSRILWAAGTQIAP